MQFKVTRLEDIVMHDPVRNLQLAGALCAYLRAFYVFAFDPWTWNAVTAYVFFYWFPEWLWAILLLIAGTWQFWAAGTRRWRQKYYAASMQVMMLTYSLVVSLFTNRGGAGVPYIVVFLCMQILIAMRSKHDQELNGTDRRYKDDDRHA